MKKNKRTKILAIFLCIFMLPLAGCSDMIEIQDRDFVLTLGVAYDKKEKAYQLTYVLPDLAKINGNAAGENDKLVRTFTDKTFTTFENLYNANSSKRLDYRHLQAIVLDKSICSNADDLEAFIKFADDNFEISRNVLIFYNNEATKELLQMDEKMSDGIGDYIVSLDKNYREKRGMESVTLSDLISGMYKEQSLVVPLLEANDNIIGINGAAILHNNEYVKTISDEQVDLYNIVQGKGSRYMISIDDGSAARINEVSSKISYQYTDKIPKITCKITGAAEILSDTKTDTSDSSLAKQLNQQLARKITREIDVLYKDDKLDYLHLYQNSAFKSRDIWLAYQEKQADFALAVQIDVSVDMKIL